MIDLATPKVVTRWDHCKPIRTQAVPTPFGQQRAEAIYQAARQTSCWAEGLQPNMTDGEIAYIMSLWDTVPGNWSFWDVLNTIRQGKVDEKSHTICS